MKRYSLLIAMIVLSLLLCACGNNTETQNTEPVMLPTTTAPEIVPTATAPATTAPETTAPETTAPETTAPATTAPATTVPATTVPATTVPVTTVPPTTVHVHSWVDATCTSAKTCTGCGAIDGDALGHAYTEGVCTVCQAEDPTYKPLDTGKWVGQQVINGGLYVVELELDALFFDCSYGDNIADFEPDFRDKLIADFANGYPFVYLVDDVYYYTGSGDGGPITYTVNGDIIEVTRFNSNSVDEISKKVLRTAQVEGFHGGGDSLLMEDFIQLLEGKGGECKTAIERSIESHIMAYAAEESRVTGKVIDIDELKDALRNK